VELWRQSKDEKSYGLWADVLCSCVESLGVGSRLRSMRIQPCQTQKFGTTPAYPRAVETFLALEGASEASKRKILWDNRTRLYGI
jgi:hypothetical protein